MKNVVVSIEPLAFRVEDLLNGMASEFGGFAVINPSTGLRIYGEKLDLPSVGLSFAPPMKKAPMGYVSSSTEVVELYKLEAEILLEPIPAGVFTGVASESWKMLIVDGDDIGKFAPIAAELMKFFKISIVMYPFSEDDDSENPDPVLVDDKFPNGPLMCPVWPKKKKE